MDFECLYSTKFRQGAGNICYETSWQSPVIARTEPIRRACGESGGGDRGNVFDVCNVG